MEDINKYGQYKKLNHKLSISDLIILLFTNLQDDKFYYMDDKGNFLLETDRNRT